MKPTTARGEVEAILKSATEPLTSIEIYEQCKIIGDRKEISTVLSQLCTAGRIKRKGERERDKGAPLTLYVIGDGTAPARPTRGRKSKAKTKAAPKRKAKSPPRKVRQPAPPQPLDAPGFRCGMFSDGTVAIHCEEGQITLQRAEAAALMAYVGILPEVSRA